MFRLLKTLIFLILLAGLMYLIRRPVLRLTGNFLIEEDSETACQAIFILSGGPDARAAEAFRLFKGGYAPYVVCTGESVPYLFDILNIKMDEADLTKIALLKNGIPETSIKLIHAGTSTKEEKDIILEYCRKQGLKKVMIISDKFHTHRINYAFRDYFEDAGIEMILRGAPSKVYDENNWWATESGMIMVNNEYIKLFYYLLHY